MARIATFFRERSLAFHLGTDGRFLWLLDGSSVFPIPPSPYSRCHLVPLPAQYFFIYTNAISWKSPCESASFPTLPLPFPYVSLLLSIYVYLPRRSVGIADPLDPINRISRRSLTRGSRKRVSARCGLGHPRKSCPCLERGSDWRGLSVSALSGVAMKAVPLPQLTSIPHRYRASNSKPSTPCLWHYGTRR